MEQIGDDFPIEHGLVSKTIERAQSSVEGYNFDIRKHLLEYDDVLNRQRETIYDERLRILQSDDLQPEVWRMLEGQVDEYLEKYGEAPDQRRLIFASLDDVVPLILPAPNAPFQGPLSFSGHLTAFPPFTISFLADQFAGQPVDAVQEELDLLLEQAAADYGHSIRESVSETAKAILERYDEHLARYQALLDEKIDDYLQLVEERGQPADARRLLQHLERTYPLQLTFPPPGEGGRDGDQQSLDDLRDHWLVEISIEYHRLTCTNMIDRVPLRLPPNVRLDRLRPARVDADKLKDELQRVQELAAKQPKEDGHLSSDQQRLSALSAPADPDVAEVWEFVTTVKRMSQIDYGRLDRLVGHVLGAELAELTGQYLDVVDGNQGRLRRDLERLQASVIEGKKGGRGNHLLEILRQLNDAVHLEITDLQEVLSQAVAHEYDKWAQRQLSEIDTDTKHARLSETTWTAIAEHLLTAHFTQRQMYDRDHQRRATWTPRLPFSYVAQAHVAHMDTEALRSQVLASMRWVLEQREQVWGQRELQHWEQLSVNDLDKETYDSLVRYLGEQQLGALRDSPVEDLPAELYDHLRFILALRRWEEQNLRVGDLPRADDLLSRLGQALKEQILDKPINELDSQLQTRIVDHLRQTGMLDDPALRAKLAEQPLRDWDQRTTEEVTGFWGREYIAAHEDQALTELDPGARERAITYLDQQRRFVDEERVQRFLLHERVSDLPPQTQEAALLELARSRLDRFSRRKIANLDVKTRQAVVASLQRTGMFTDKARRDELLGRSASLADLAPEARAGFGRLLARQRLENEGLSGLDAEVQRHVLDQMKQADALLIPRRLEELPTQRLADLDAAGDGAIDGNLAAQIREQLVSELQADLDAKAMEELPAETRDLIHQALDEQNYFVDPEKVTWYERKTLAQLPSDLLQGLELCLGRVRLAGIADIPFRDLPSETQEGLQAFLDREGLLTDRATRLRLTQTGALNQFPQEVRTAATQHLGRQWLTQIRDQRPPNLPDDAREIVWACLRGMGYFADEFKEELFAFQRLDEFDAATRRLVQKAFKDQVISTLEEKAIGDLPHHFQTVIRARLSEADYFVDRDRMRQVEELPFEQLPPDLRQVMEQVLGKHFLSSLDSAPVGDLPAAIQEVLWSHLDEIGYFVDDRKQNEVLDRRLADLRSEVFETLVADLAASLREEIGDSPVADLDDELRQGLREALEELGYFESDQVKAQVLGLPLGNLRREELEALAVEFGQLQWELRVESRLSDLPAAERAAVLSHLQARDWFLDQARLAQLMAQPLRDLQPDIRSELVESLGDQEVAHLRRKRLADLDRTQSHAIHRIMQEQGLALEEGRMRPLHRQKVSELDQEVYRDLLRDLGDGVIAGWDTVRFRDREGDQQATLTAYLGRQIMSRIERRVLLYTISRLWIDYLTDIEDLRRGIGLEAYGQRDPLVEYKRRAFELFEELGDNIRRTVARSLFQQSPQPLRAE
jgi:hypothetical protein